MDGIWQILPCFIVPYDTCFMHYASLCMIYVSNDIWFSNSFKTSLQFSTFKFRLVHMVQPRSFQSLIFSFENVINKVTLSC